MKKLLVLLALTTCITTGFADAESHKAAAEELISMVAPKEMFMESFNSVFATQVDQFRQMGIGQEQIDQIIAASKEFGSAVANDPELTARMITIYQGAFSETELKELIAFYKTPIGKKTLEELPRLMQEGAMVGQQVAMKHQAAFQAKIQAIMTEGMTTP
ncbi:DUF2059 domain-containing protein [Pontiella agarivorans]|uniref:DUF2059 domain-containing protein n=1 Tax=Pontiella agarivorans TaxID=3038953 RepID=A0ABU5MXC5_9BACT|nr:DUF2059 domain-containing protein [Pontiella agarivorans]MDZ8118616.1 DUF2059 domain-containing protein [Pontiella agarivorans]